MFGVTDPAVEEAVRAYVKLMRASRSVLARIEPGLAARGLTPTQLGVLEALLHKGAMTHGDLGRKVLTSAGNITDVVDKLQARGLVARARDAADRRAVRVDLTDSGRALIEELFPCHAADIARAMAGLSGAELRALGALLRRLGLGPEAVASAEDSIGMENGMSIVEDLLRDIALPRMIPVRQNFAATALPDVAAAVRAECGKPEIAALVRPRARVAVAVGSRGVAELPVLVGGVIAALRGYGAVPFVVPAMGSHGGATAAGQTELLARLGVTEASVGCPIVSSMETVQLGVMADTGLPVLMDREAMAADGIVVINRIKPHTSFSGPIESGLVKMITIGLGKQKGADSCHAFGFGAMARNIVEMAKVKLREAPFLFGLASVENAYDKVARVVAIPAGEIIAAEPALLEQAQANMPRIRFNPLDVLVIERMGKEFSGAGMDPNITGRADTPFVNVTQKVAAMAVLDLSETSHGNASGMGLADVCTRRLFDKIDFDATYANHITAAVLPGAKVPVIMENDRMAVQIAIRGCSCPDRSRLRLVRMKNTLNLETILISEAMLEEALGNPDITVIGEAQEWAFDEGGNLRF